jgi:hypothetical protein
MPRLLKLANADTIKIGEFLATGPGLALLAALYSRRPPLEGDTTEKRMISGLEASGWEKCVEEIQTIAAERGDVPDLGQDKFMNMSVEDDRKHNKPE